MSFPAKPDAVDAPERGEHSGRLCVFFVGEVQVMNRALLSILGVLVGLTVGSATANDVPRIAAPNPVVVPDAAPAPPAVVGVGDGPAPASEKVRQAYAEQKAAKAQGKRSGARAQAKKAKSAKVAKAKHKKSQKIVGKKRKHRAA